MELIKVLTLFNCKINLNDRRLCWNISSINENKVKSLLQNQGQQLVYFHKNNFSRVYPAGLRIDSSNYDPVPGFLAGSQIVALNQQTCDRNMMIYYGKFLENGGVRCGYLLKPEWMIQGSTVNDVRSPSSFAQPLKLLKVKIISAQYLSVGEDAF